MEEKNEELEEGKSQDVIVETPKKSKKLPIILIIVVVLLIAILCAFLLLNQGDSKNSNNKTSNEENTDKKEEKEDNPVEEKSNFDFSTMESDLNDLIDLNEKEQIILCEEVGNNSSKYAKKDSVSLIIDKLKKASSFEETTYELNGCPRNNILYIIGSSIDTSKFSLNYADDENTLLIGYNEKMYAFKFDDKKEIVGFIESLEDVKTPEELLKIELIDKLIKIGFSDSSASYYEESDTISVCSDGWYPYDKVTVDDLSKSKLVQTAVNNLDLSKANRKEGRFEGTYTLEEMNDYLGKVIYGKSITVDDIKNNMADIAKINGNNITITIPYEKECWFGPYTDSHIEKISTEGDKAYVFQKVAFCFVDNIDDPSSETSCYKDPGKSTKREKRIDNKSWDKYNTYKVTFKLINGNYFFDSYELVK